MECLNGKANQEQIILLIECKIYFWWSNRKNVSNSEACLGTFSTSMMELFRENI